MRFLAGVAAALIGAALVTLELALTRLVGYLVPSSLAFHTISLAVFGMAAGALLAHRLGWRPDRRPGIVAAGAALGGALATLLVALTNAGFMTGVALVGLFSTYLLVYLVGVGIGAALAAAFSWAPRGAAWLAAAEFLAGGLAGLAGAPLLNAWGPPATALLGAALLGLAGLVALPGSFGSRPAPAGAEDDDEQPGVVGKLLGVGLSALLALLSVAAFGAQLAIGWSTADPGMIDSNKNLFQSVGTGPNEKVIFSRWSADSRTDVTETARDPVKWVYRDGDFVGYMYPSTQGAGFPRQAQEDISTAPFVLPGVKDKVLIIGVGGGAEVLFALSGGAREVVVVEPDAGVIEASRALSSFNGGLLDRPGVRVVQQEARAFLRGSGEQFDVIFLTLAASAAAAPGGASPGADLYTIEAFGEYMEALRQDGRLAVRLHDVHEMLRAFNTGLQTWTRRGAAPVEAIRRMIVLTTLSAQAAQQQQAEIDRPLLTVRKTPYLQDEVQGAMQALVQAQAPFPPVYLPHFEQESMQQFPALVAMAQDEIGPGGVEAQAPFDIRPATDAWPFYFEPSRGLPVLSMGLPLFFAVLTGLVALGCRRPVWEGLDGGGVTGAEAAAFLESAVPWRYLGFAFLAGGAWGLLTVPMLHRLPVLIGQPSTAAGIVLGTLLVGAALGAAIAAPASPLALRQVIGWGGLAGGVFALAGLELLPLVYGALRGQGNVAPIVATAVLTLPIGLCLGIPLPGAIRLLSTGNRGGWAAAFLAVAFFSWGFWRIMAYGLGRYWGFTVPVALAGAFLFGTFLIAGLRALSLPAEERDEDADGAVDHAPFKPAAERQADVAPAPATAPVQGTAPDPGPDPVPAPPPTSAPTPPPAPQPGTPSDAPRPRL